MPDAMPATVSKAVRAHCPQGLSPTASIAGLKRKTFAALLKGAL